MSHQRRWIVWLSIAVTIGVGAIVYLASSFEQVIVSGRGSRPVASFDVPLPEFDQLSLEFSRDAETIAVSAYWRDGPVFFFDVPTGKQRSRWEWPRFTGGYTPFEPAGEWLVTTTGKVGGEYQVRRVNPGDGTETVVFWRPWSEFTLKPTENSGADVYVRTPVRLSPDVRTWFHARPGIGIEVWDVVQNIRQHVLDFDNVVQLAVSPNSEIVAAFNEQGDVRVWDVTSGAEQARFSGLTDFQRGSFQIDDSGVVLVDQVQQLYGTEHSIPHATRALLGPESGRVVQIPDRRVLQRFPNGDVVLAREPLMTHRYPSFPADRHDPPLSPRALLREDRSGTALWSRELELREAKSIQVTPFHLLVQDSSNRVTVVDLKDGNVVWSLDDRTGGSGHSFALSPDGRFVAHGYADGPRKAARVRIWRLSGTLRVKE